MTDELTAMIKFLQDTSLARVAVPDEADKRFLMQSGVPEDQIVIHKSAVKLQY